MNRLNEPFPGAGSPVERPAFNLGGVRILPAARTLEGPAATLAVEPRIMQVLLVLVDAGGGVVTRATLFERCWNGVVVGDDALNRAIFELRRALQAVGSEISVETIPKTGYRLDGLPASGGADVVAPAPETPDPSGPAVSRRKLLGGAIAAGVAVAGGGGIYAWRHQSAGERQAAALVERGDIVRRNDMPDADEQGIGFYREALKLTPDDAAIWGKLALSWAAVAEYAAPDATAQAVSSTQLAARRALDLQPGQPDARVALEMLTPDFGLWHSAEQTLRGILAAAPDNVAAQARLALILMEVGRVEAGTAIIDRLVEREPLSPSFQYRHVYQLWARGRLKEADQTADRALQLWPRHPSVWLARYWTFGLTGRAPMARRMVEDRSRRPDFPDEMVDLLRRNSAALETRSRADIAAAVAANLAATNLGQFGAVSAILTLPLLGAEAVAYDVGRGYLLREGSLVGSLGRPADQPAINDQNRRKTMMLWMPSAAALRADARFLPLCRAIGLGDYWRQAGQGPDYLKRAGG
nr:tetratricopeptide repeat protein [Sphingobium nicotianae]